MTAAYQLTPGSSVFRNSDGAVIPDDLKNSDWVEYQAWLTAGGIPDPVPGITSQQLEASFSTAIQNWLDTTAKSFNYDSIESACTYISDPNTLWSNQGKAFVTWRSAVWTQVYAELATVIAGQAQAPVSVEQYLTTLAQPNIPTSVS